MAQYGYTPIKIAVMDKRLDTLEIEKIPKLYHKNEISRGIVRNVHDGDTVTIGCYLGDTLPWRYEIRLLGLDTPEVSSKDPLHKAAADKVRDHVATLILDKKIFFKITGTDKYGGRHNAHIYLDRSCNVTLTDHLLAKKYAKPFNAKVKKTEWTEEDLQYILDN